MGGDDIKLPQGNHRPITLILTLFFFIFFFNIYNFFHIANQLCQHSSTSRTIASSQHHPRETRPLLSQSNLYKNCFIGFAYYEFVSYITRNASMFLLIQFLPFSYFFFFLSFHFIYNMKVSQCLC